MFNILNEPLIRMDTADGVRWATLPELYAALMADEVEAFPALRPHQRHAWHAFLVQLGAIAMHRAKVSAPPTDSDEWAGIISALTPDDGSWHLVEDDITKPAFMQPPASSADRLADYKNRVESADELDMLVTSKNHDLKASVVSQAGVDDWIFALVTLQTMEGFGGAGNYGISRMNGGLGNRPAFSLAPLGGPGAHVRRDIIALHDSYPTVAGGHSLLWLLQWNGTDPERLLLDQLASHYIEICRRIRLCSDGNTTNLYAIRASSKVTRIESKAAKGRTGDPWTPIDNKGNKSLTLAAGGFNYRRVVQYLTNVKEWEKPILLRPTRAERRSQNVMQLVARAMVRGQGKTEGYHERIIPIRSRARNATDALGNLAQERIRQVGIVQGILRHAIATFLARGESRDTSPEQRALANPWANRLDEIVDRTFFDDLQDEFDLNDAAERQRIRNQWLLNDRKEGVVDHARKILEEATSSLPCPAAHRYRARENAEGLFEGRLRGSGGLPFLFDDNQGV